MMRIPGPQMGEPDPEWVDQGTSARTRMFSPAERLAGDATGSTGHGALMRVGRVRDALRAAGPLALHLLGQRLAGIELADIARGLIAACEDIALYYGGAVAAGTVLGGGIGFLAGGVGALPGAFMGAVAGSHVGLWILAAFGLESLAEFFFEGLPSILRCYQRGFTEAWHDRHGLGLGVRDIAEGHVAVMMLLLGAIVAHLTRGRGDMQALAGRVRASRLGERFASWLLKNEERLREHPNLQPRQPRPAGAGGGHEPPPPPKPPTRRGEGEPGGPRKMKTLAALFRTMAFRAMRQRQRPPRWSPKR